MKTVFMILLVLAFSSGNAQEAPPKVVIQEKASSQNANPKTQAAKKSAPEPPPSQIVFIDATSRDTSPKDDEKAEAKEERAKAELTVGPDKIADRPFQYRA